MQWASALLLFAAIIPVNIVHSMPISNHELLRATKPLFCNALSDDRRRIDHKYFSVTTLPFDIT